MNPKDKHHLCRLVLKFKDRTITAEEQSELDRMLSEQPESAELMMQLMEVYTYLMRSDGAVMSHADMANVTGQDMLHQLSEWENVAPSITAEKASPEDCHIIRKVVRQRSRRQLNKTSAAIALLSMAAVLFIVLFLRFAPAPSVEVATLTNSYNAVFAHENYVPGSRLSSNAGSLWLQKGVVEITFDYGAGVVIEAPAEFQLNSAENIAMHSGRLYAHVPEHSKGFMVETPSSRVIDLGTEFGVKVDFDGSSDVYMIKGKASVFSGSRGKTGQGQILTAGDARRIDPKGGIHSIPMRRDGFARRLSNAGLIWRGQDLNLADIVGGGCGLGDGRPQNSIDPSTGQVTPWKIASDRSGNGRYLPVTASRFIDGVFVPDGGQGPIQVTSANHTWQAPDTSNNFKYNIVNSLRIPANLDDYADYVETPGHPVEDMLLTEAVDGRVPVRMLGLMANASAPAASDSSIFMHANLGLTFDLQTIQKVLPENRIMRFKSTFGIGEITARRAQRLDVWVLVDGQTRFEHRNVDIAALTEITVELSGAERFLTLVVTDGSDRAFNFDWGLFMNPRLEVD